MADVALTPALLLAAYRQGVFPMADGRNDPDIFWVDPQRRGILPLKGFRLARSLAKTIRQGRLDVTLDHAFVAVVEGCAEREETWINATILDLYAALHSQGRGHSVEVWEEGQLIGGAYGVALGAAFFGESMFSRRRDASKVALAYLVGMLRRGGFRLLDTQFLTPHLASLGGIEISRGAYRRALAEALGEEGTLAEPVPSPAELLGLLA